VGSGGWGTALANPAAKLPISDAEARQLLTAIEAIDWSEIVPVEKDCTYGDCGLKTDELSTFAFSGLGRMLMTTGAWPPVRRASRVKLSCVVLRKLLPMEDPEAYLRALTARLGSARDGGPLPVVRFSLEAVANAFVMLGLLPAARAGEILAAQRSVLEAAGFRVGLEIGELSVGPGARGFQEARAAGADSLQRIPLAVAAGPVRCPLRGDGLAVTSATLTPEGIWLRYCGDPRESDRHGANALIEEIHEKITELSVTDDSGGTYEVPPGNLPGAISGQSLMALRTAVAA
jgi:hypothetical protein